MRASHGGMKHEARLQAGGGEAGSKHLTTWARATGASSQTCKVIVSTGRLQGSMPLARRTTRAVGQSLRWLCERVGDGRGLPGDG